MASLESIAQRTYFSSLHAFPLENNFILDCFLQFQHTASREQHTLAEQNKLGKINCYPVNYMQQGWPLYLDFLSFCL